MASVTYRVDIINGQRVLVRVMPEREQLFPDVMNARGRQSRNRCHRHAGYQPKGIRPGWRA